MRVVGWILKIYCNLVETGETKDNWENFKTFQDKVLEEINLVLFYKEGGI